MTINNPLALIFAAVIPVIVALYLLRLKRKKKLVASTFFWTEIVQDLQANVPFQKLRWNILLLLQILIALAIIGAMVDLSVRAALNEGQRTIFVLDTSAGMGAKEGGSTRLENAKNDIKMYCRNLAQREQVMIIEAGEYARVILDFTGSFQAVERALDSVKTQDTRSDLATAYSLAVGKASEVDKPRIVIVSDFSGFDPEIFSDAQYPVSFLQTGRGGRNVAITDFAIAGLAETETGRTFNAFLAVRNYTDQKLACDVEFYVEGGLADVRTIEVDPGSRVAKVYNEIPYSDGVVEVRLDTVDSLDIDNVAYGIPPASEAMEILVAGDDPFLVFALSGIPGTRLYRIPQNEYAAGAGYDLTFFPGWAPEQLPPGNYVFFNPPNRDYLPCKMSNQVETPKVTDWDDGHPMLRFVNPGSFNVFAATKVEPVPGAMTLVDADKTPLMVYGERNYLRALVFSFDLTSTDLITRPTFPILMYNVVSFYRSYLESGSSGLRTQGIEAIRVEELGEKVKLTGPDGVELEFPIDAGHAFIDVNTAGVYNMQVVGGTKESSRKLVANFFDEAESDIASVANLEEQLGEDKVMRFEVQGEKRIWKWLSVMALVILSGEWFFYHRKGF